MVSGHGLNKQGTGRPGKGRDGSAGLRWQSGTGIGSQGMQDTATQAVIQMPQNAMGCLQS